MCNSAQFPAFEVLYNMVYDRIKKLLRNISVRSVLLLLLTWISVFFKHL